MSYIFILMLAIALSVDACIVSFTYGLKYNHMRLKNSMLLACFTGSFQALFPILGYFLTSFVRIYIQPYANLIVFLIFSYLGFKFIIEANQPKMKKDLCIGIKCLFLIGIATSIDAFAAGITLSLSGTNIFKPALLIGFVTFINSHLGFFLGGRFKHIPTKYLEIFAGILLLIIGFKTIM